MKASYIIFFMILVAKLTESGTLQDLSALLPQAHQQVDTAIMKDLIKQYSNIKNVHDLAKKFHNYKIEWKEKMIQYLITQLQINEEDAKQARKNPQSYFINYDTYKLFALQH